MSINIKVDPLNNLVNLDFKPSTMMTKRIIPCVFCFLLIFFSTSCKKTEVKDELESLSTNKALSSDLKQKVIAYLDERKASSKSDFSKLLIDSIKNKLDWDKTYINPKNKESQIVIPFKNSNDNAFRNKVLFLNEYMPTSNINSAYIIELIPNPQDKEVILTETIVTLLNDKNSEYSGSLIKESLFKKFIYELNFENGKLKTHKSILKKNTVSNSSGRTNGCFDWYWVTTYSDGSQTWDYLYTTCDNDCQATRIISNNTVIFKANCGGGGGPTDPPLIADTLNPCREVDSLTRDAVFIGKMQFLKDGTFGNNYETGFVKGLDVFGNPVYQQIDGPAGQLGLPNFTLSSPIDGIIHNHWNSPKALSIFSPDDLRSLYNIYKNNMANPGFDYGVVTASGTTYVLKVENLSSFLQFGDMWFADNVTFNAFSHTYGTLYNISTTNTSDVNEFRFVQMLNTVGAGLKLFTGITSNFASWQPQGLNDTNTGLMLKPCN